MDDILFYFYLCLGGNGLEILTQNLTRMKQAADVLLERQLV